MATQQDLDSLVGLYEYTDKKYLEGLGIKIIYENDIEYIVTIPPKALHKLDFWELNRKCDTKNIDDLVLALRKNLKKSSNKSWNTSIIVLSLMEISINENDYELHILDGQHRISAMKKILQEIKSNKLPSIIAHIKKVKNTNEKMNIFEITNNVTPISEGDLPSKQIKDVIGNLEEKFVLEKGFHIYRNGGRRPYLKQDDLKNELDDLDWASNNSRDILESLLKVNKYYKNLDKKNMLEKELCDDSKKWTKKSIELAREFGFYLGLDKNFKFMKIVLDKNYKYIEIKKPIKKKKKIKKSKDL